MDTDARVSFGTLVLPNEPWQSLEERWSRLDAGGIDSIWSCDHFTNPHSPRQPWFEGIVSLAGIAQTTDHARIGLLVSAIVSRSPNLLAKQALTLDHMSRGRLVVGIGAGGAITDQRMWGEPDWSTGERARRFTEYVELLDRLLRNDGVTYSGEWYSTTGASMAPGCMQSPRPPILMAAHGPATLKVAARVADVWNTMGPTLEDAVSAMRDLDAACGEAGRDPTQIRRSVLFGLRNETVWRDALEFADLVRRWHEAGFRDFLFYDPPYATSGLPVASDDVIEELVSTTIPDLRNELG